MSENSRNEEAELTSSDCICFYCEHNGEICRQCPDSGYSHFKGIQIPTILPWEE